MSKKSIEARVAQLEQEIARQKKILKSAGIDDDFVSVAIASKILKVENHVIYRRIKKPDAVLNKHYIRNGSRYKINVKEYQKLIFADDSAKLA